MIDTRQEMLIALSEAAELEHNLACLYLFAAFTIKDDVAQDGITAEQANRLGEWKDTILEIAKQEMGHLGTVCNLITAIGGAPHFRRTNFPQPPKHFPPDIDFVLERFGLTSLRRFVEFERPELAPPLALLDIAPEVLTFTRVGDLYRQIRDGFLTMDEIKLFINADATQDSQPWSPSVGVRPIKNRSDAIAAIGFIIEQGEGTPAALGDSHYEKFRSMADGLKRMIQDDPSFDPARMVAANPQTRKHRDAQAGALISDPITREIAELFNVLYDLALHMLAQYYAFASEEATQQNILRRTSVMMMRQVIRPLGEMLTVLSMGPDHPGLTAGPGFEIYGEESLTSKPRVAWDVFLERLEVYALQAQQLANQSSVISQRLINVANKLISIRDLLKSVKPV